MSKGITKTALLIGVFFVTGCTVKTETTAPTPERMQEIQAERARLATGKKEVAPTGRYEWKEAADVPKPDK